MTKEQAAMELLAEVCRAMEIHPVWPEDLIHQIAKVAEESGEALQAANNVVEKGASIDLVRTELIHTGAMAIRALVNLREVVKMTNIEELEQQKKELIAKLVENDRQIEAMKKQKIVFDWDKNYGAISNNGKRFVLTGNNQLKREYSFVSFDDCANQWDDTMEEGQNAIDKAIEDGLKVIELNSNPEAVANFLLGKD